MRFAPFFVIATLPALAGLPANLSVAPACADASPKASLVVAAREHRLLETTDSVCDSTAVAKIPQFPAD
jgi:hypothetical protein